MRSALLLAAATVVTAQADDLYVSKRKAFLELFDVMHMACEKGDMPLTISGKSAEAKMHAFLRNKPSGLYAVNAFAGPSPWTKGANVPKQTKLGYLAHGDKWRPNTDPVRAKDFETRYGSNANAHCGASNPSWDPVLARKTASAVEFPRSTNDRTKVLNCYHDGYDQKVDVICQRRGPPQPCSDFSLINKYCPSHALGRVIPAVCDSESDHIDDDCKDTYMSWYNRCSKSNAVSALHSSISSQLHEFALICKSTPTFFVRRDQLTLQKGVELAVIDEMPEDYSISFDVTLGSRINRQWTSIIHFSSNGHDCCNYGDRIPAIFLEPNTRRMLIVDGHAQKGNDVIDGCPASMMTLKPGQKTHVRVEFGQVSVKVYIDRKLACTEVRRDRKAYKHVHVYAADGWYGAADASISNFALDPQRDYFFMEATACKAYAISLSLPLALPLSHRVAFLMYAS